MEKKNKIAHAVLVRSCSCTSPKEPPAAIAASELTRTSILHIMHLYNLLDFICIGVSHSNEKPPELTVTIPDAAPRGSIKHAVVYFLNSQAWLHAAHYSNHADASFISPSCSGDGLSESQGRHKESAFGELKCATSQTAKCSTVRWRIRET